MREFVQARKNRIIIKIYGQFHYGIAHFQKEKDKSEFSIEFCICKRYNKQRYKEVSCHLVVKCKKHSFTHR